MRASLLCLAFVSAFAHAVELRPGGVEVVTSPDACSVVRFAAAELATFVGQSLGQKVPVVTSFTAGRMALVVGTNNWSRAAGIAPEKLPRDGFIVKSSGDRIYLAGCDTPRESMRNLLEAKHQFAFVHGERATIFAVYGFLERYLGVRFYWPDECGTIVPPHASLCIPDGEWRCAPDFTVREPSFTRPIQYLRLRAQTKYTPCCHGLAALSLRERFYASHPEYFALRPGPKGEKVREPALGDKVSKRHAGQLCWTSTALWDQIYADAVAYFSGVSAKEHGVIYHWGDGTRYGWANGWYGEYFDVMGQDGYQPCLCAACQAAYSKTDNDQYATELVWGKTAELANRLLRAGVKGTLTQMAYPPYRHIPTCAIPTNVLVMVAERGPWNAGDPKRAAADDDEVRAWAKKVGRKVWLWTYPGKIGSLQLDDVPQMTPRAHGDYFKRLAPYIFGAKTEAESDKPVYNYLNDYVLSRLSWDNTVDVAALLDEHYRLMFGAAAHEMRGFYELLEDKWLREIAGRTQDTAVGPIAIAPSVYELWTKIYSPAVLDRCEAFFARALALVRPNAAEAQRVLWAKRHFCDPLVTRGRRMAVALDVARERSRRAREKPVNLLGAHPEKGWYAWPSTNFTLQTRHAIAHDRTYVTHNLDGLLETGSTYRVSLFLKGRDIVPFSTWDGGLNVEISDGVKKWRYPYPNGNNGVGFTGTFDGLHGSFEFTTGTTIGAHSYLSIRLANCTGEVWFDSPLLELQKGKE